MQQVTRWLAERLTLDRADTDDAQRGASLVEYALLVALIALVCVAAVAIVGDTTTASLSSTGSSIASATG